MYRRHVYTDATKLTPEFIDRKYQITQQPGARFAPAAFVTGALDPAINRDDFLAGFQGLLIPVMVIIGEQAPPKSKAEMEALAELSEVQVNRLPGTLGLYEDLQPSSYCYCAISAHLDRTISADVTPLLSNPHRLSSHENDCHD